MLTIFIIAKGIAIILITIGKNPTVLFMYIDFAVNSFFGLHSANYFDVRWVFMGFLVDVER